MTKVRVQLGVAVAAVLLVGLGCSKKKDDTVTIEQVPQVMEEAFKQAEPQVNQQVDQAVTAVKQEDPRALEQLQTLSSRPDLTIEQRRAADRAMYATLRRLQEAAKQGDQKAEAELKRYRATK